MRHSAGENSLFFLVILKQCLVCFNSGIWLFLTSVFELLREYCLTNRVKLSIINLQYENDMIIFLIY